MEIISPVISISRVSLSSIDITVDNYYTTIIKLCQVGLGGVGLGAMYEERNARGVWVYCATLYV
jgi:hypothetical protein